MRIAIMNDGSLKVKKTLRKDNVFRKIPDRPHGSECWSVFAEMKKRFEGKYIMFYRRILKIPQAEHVCNEMKTNDTYVISGRDSCNFYAT